MNDDIKIYRQGQGAPLTLLHGWGMNAAVFAPLADALARDFTVYRVDLPGYGLSLWQSERFDEQVERLAAAIEDSILIGWSLGGLYAQALAARFPERFERLMLLNYNPCFVQRDDWSCAVAADVFEAFSASLEDGWSATIRRFLGLQMHGVDAARELVREMTRLVVAGGEPRPGVLAFGLDLLLQSDARAQLAAMQTPTMLLLGERDTLVPVCVGAQIHRLNPSVRVECVARSAHAPFLSHRETVVDLIREFAQPTPPR